MYLLIVVLLTRSIGQLGKTRAWFPPGWPTYPPARCMESNKVPPMPSPQIPLPFV